MKEDTILIQAPGKILALLNHRKKRIRKKYYSLVYKGKLKGATANILKGCYPVCADQSVAENEISTFTINFNYDNYEDQHDTKNT